VLQRHAADPTVWLYGHPILLTEILESRVAKG
jgi:hypothetical protein